MLWFSRWTRRFPFVMAALMFFLNLPAFLIQPLRGSIPFSLLVSVAMAGFTIGVSVVVLHLLVLVNAAWWVLSGRWKGVACEHALELSEEGIEEVTPVNRAFHGWSEEMKIEETAGFYFLYVTKHQLHLVPRKKGLREGNPEAFILEFRAKSARAKQERRQPVVRDDGVQLRSCDWRSKGPVRVVLKVLGSVVLTACLLGALFLTAAMLTESVINPLLRARLASNIVAAYRASAANGEVVAPGPGSDTVRAGAACIHSRPLTVTVTAEDGATHRYRAEGYPTSTLRAKSWSFRQLSRPDEPTVPDAP
jgi:hypothetical protein